MKHALKLALAAFAAALLAGCAALSKDKDGRGEAPGAETPKAQPLARPAITAPPVPEAKIVSLPFRVDVAFTQGALERLLQANAEVGVGADYYGTPKEPARAGLDPDLGIWLGGEMDILAPGARSLTFKGEIDAARVAREVSGDARVKVTVFPVRASAAEVAMICTEFEEYLSIAVETGAALECSETGD